jgi:hypothetical protein
MSDSTVLTIGTALRRACSTDVEVHVLIQGSWLAGRVLAVDGHGVVLSETHTDANIVLRLADISGLKADGHVAPGRLEHARSLLSSTGNVA